MKLSVRQNISDTLRRKQPYKRSHKKMEHNLFCECRKCDRPVMAYIKDLGKA